MGPRADGLTHDVARDVADVVTDELADDRAEVAAPAFLHTVADDHRWRILRSLARSDRRVGELTELLGKPQNLVSYHLAELRKAGLVTARRSSADGRDTYYRVDLSRCRDLLAAVGAALHPGLVCTTAAPDALATPRGRPAVVLFLCTGNSARSQMAEALLEHRSGGRIRACSAGSHPKPLHPNAVKVMAERGIDISGRTTKHVSRFARRRFTRVITLCDKVREVCTQLPDNHATAHWSMPDPAASGDGDAETYPAFRRTADELEARIEMLVAELTTASTPRRPHAD